jgi:hypothetical protein
VRVRASEGVVMKNREREELARAAVLLREWNTPISHPVWRTRTASVAWWCWGIAVDGEWSKNGTYSAAAADIAESLAHDGLAVTR